MWCQPHKRATALAREGQVLVTESVAEIISEGNNRVPLQSLECPWMYPLPHSSHNANHQLGEEIKSGERKKRNKNSRPGNTHIKHSIVLAPK